MYFRFETEIRYTFSPKIQGVYLFASCQKLGNTVILGIDNCWLAGDGFPFLGAGGCFCTLGFPNTGFLLRLFNFVQRLTANGKS